MNSDGTAGDYEFITVGEVDLIVQKVKGAMSALGVEAGRKVALYGKNKPEWLIADYACQSRSNCTVPLYDTLGPEASEYVIGHAEVGAVFCDWDVLENSVNAALKSGIVSFVCAFPLQAFQKTPEALKQYEDAVAKAKGNGVDVYSWEEFLSKSVPCEDVPPKPEDLCTICYTSGTTGTPKGAMITHRGLIANSLAAQKYFAATEEDAVISYLPLAHMFERMVEVLVLMNGASTAFFRGDTLLLLEDIAAAKPTLFVSVPRLYNKIYDKILAGVNEGSFVKRFLFNTIYNRKLGYLKQAEENIDNMDPKNPDAQGAIDNLTSNFDFVFAKVRDALGGRVRMLASGSAPISATVLDFLRVTLSAPVFEGYGQTECTCAATISMSDEQFGGAHVGTPIACGEVCLMSVPEMNYTINDKIDGKQVERGEICFRGNHVFEGYWKNPEKTAETLDEDGWLHSGDIGVWLPNGNLKIIDRKKNIFKLSQGEYVAPEKIENVYIQSKWVAQSFVYGNSMERFLVCVVVPDEDVLTPWCKQNGIGGTFTDWCKNDKIKQMIAKDMEEKANLRKLQGFERVKAMHLHDELFTPENGVLTPTFKLKRSVAQKLFQPEIDAMYASFAKSGVTLRSKL